MKLPIRMRRLFDLRKLYTNWKQNTMENTIMTLKIETNLQF
jgi:hypothetical protein